jgi:hypothetical protein
LSKNIVSHHFSSFSPPFFRQAGKEKGDNSYLKRLDLKLKTAKNFSRALKFEMNNYEKNATSHGVRSLL